MEILDKQRTKYRQTDYMRRKQYLRLIRAGAIARPTERTLERNRIRVTECGEYELLPDTTDCQVLPLVPTANEN